MHLVRGDFREFLVIKRFIILRPHARLTKPILKTKDAEG